MTKNILEYKGYTGSTEISVEDDCLFGRLMFIDDLITYEGSTPGQLYAGFKDAVDRYLAYCEETGTPPNKQYSGTFNVRIGPDLHRDSCKAAMVNNQTLNDFVKECLNDRLSPNRVVVAVTETHHHYHPDKETYDEESNQSWSQKNPETPSVRTH